MSAIVCTGTSRSASPASLSNQSGMIAISASATGSGTWSTNFNVQPVDDAGTLGPVLVLTVTNLTGAVWNAPFFSPYTKFSCWFDTESGTITDREGVVMA